MKINPKAQYAINAILNSRNKAVDGVLQFLKKEGCLDKYFKALVNEKFTQLFNDKKWDEISKGENLHTFLSMSFNWASTKEGFDYWYLIDNKLKEYLSTVGFQLLSGDCEKLSISEDDVYKMLDIDSNTESVNTSKNSSPTSKNNDQIQSCKKRLLLYIKDNCKEIDCKNLILAFGVNDCISSNCISNDLSDFILHTPVKENFVEAITKMIADKNIQKFYECYDYKKYYSKNIVLNYETCFDMFERWTEIDKKNKTKNENNNNKNNMSCINCYDYDFNHNYDMLNDYDDYGDSDWDYWSGYGNSCYQTPKRVPQDIIDNLKVSTNIMNVCRSINNEVVTVVSHAN